MTSYLVVGAGLIGTSVARLLADRGDTVTVATRRGTAVPGTTAVSLEASDADRLADAASGSFAIINCVNPPYGQWETLWPPMFAALVEAARRSGAALVTMGNLYQYGRATMPMTEHSPDQPADAKGEIRRAGWQLAKDAHDRGEIRAVEVRASDYFGPGAGPTAHLGARFFTPVLTGGTARVVGDPTLAHSWAYLPDIAKTIVAAIDYEGQWGRVWHVPAASDLSRTTILDQLRIGYGATGKLSPYPPGMLAAVGLFSRDIREVSRSSYQFRMPFVNTADDTERELGVTATPWPDALSTTVASYR